ncbi:hypothetical protein SLEP1_g38837 [Rubroshorea leprosula]|uniref:Uncharacterized protein n=1 Tax=Rubroshorea leprosula TaxID=152421 RepID=A0AAV5KYZ8_9ROSI|nr:hypothetical protein SLEP1_g38837 [Rubroshorea leprosula]
MGQLLRAIFLALCALWMTPGFGAAKHAGITRHYKFDVSIGMAWTISEPRAWHFPRY